MSETSSYDPTANAIYVRIADRPVARTRELVESEVMLDFDADEELIGIEVLGVVYDPDDEGRGFTVTVPALPGLVTQGETMDGATAMACDAIKLYVEDVFEDVREAITAAMEASDKLKAATPEQRANWQIRGRPPVSIRWPDVDEDWLPTLGLLSYD